MRCCVRPKGTRSDGVPFAVDDELALREESGEAGYGGNGEDLYRTPKKESSRSFSVEPKGEVPIAKAFGGANGGAGRARAESGMAQNARTPGGAPLPMRSLEKAQSSSSEGCTMVQATMVASLLVFLYEGLAFNAVYLGRILPALDKEALVLPYMIVFNAMWGLAVWSYVVAHASDPGVVPRQWHEFVSHNGEGLTVVPARLEWQPGKATLCRKCGTPRPERAHHCHVCDVCILRMDHHCPWIKNCVGFKNYKFFILLVVYSTMSAALSLCLTLPELVLCTKTLLRLEDPAGDGQPRLQISDMLVFIIFGTLASFFLALLLPMLVTHIPMLASNMTSIESHYDDTIPNPFDRGTFMGNIAQSFGEYGLDWFFPVYPHTPLSDGVSFSRDADDASRWEELVRNREEEVMERLEALWVLRYNVRSKIQSRGNTEEMGDFAPLTQITRWMRGGSDDGTADNSEPLSLKCTRPSPDSVA